jgi:hypothetical protein
MVGDNVMAVLSSHKAVKEIIDMQGNASGNRPKTTIGDTVTGGVHMAQAQAGESQGVASALAPHCTQCSEPDDPRWMTLRRAVRSMLTKQKCEEHWPIQRAESVQLAFDIMNDPHVRSSPLLCVPHFLTPSL